VLDRPREAQGADERAGRRQAAGQLDRHHRAVAGRAHADIAAGGEKAGRHRRGPVDQDVAAGGEAFAGQFEDVTAETLVAEEAAEYEAGAGDQIMADGEAEAGLAAGHEQAIEPAASPVAHIIQRIGQMTRELADQPPAEAPALTARPQVRQVQVALHRVAS